MNPNPEKFPLLSFVLSKLNHDASSQLSPLNYDNLITSFPHLVDAKVITLLVEAFPVEIAQTHFLLGSLGLRPDPETVASARSQISQIQETSPEVEMCRAVVRLDEMHEEYATKLREAEEMLGRVYGSLQDVNEDVVKILREAENGSCVERVELVDRQLRFLPEAFGKLQGIVSLNISHNQLEVTYVYSDSTDFSFWLSLVAKNFDTTLLLLLVVMFSHFAEFIPDSISGLQKLEVLNFSTNLLQSLPDSIGLLLNLKILNVSGNKLNALPESIAGCSSLVELDASFNNLVSLPTNIGYGLLNLQRLLIHLNKIHWLPPSVCEMRSLRYLDVHFNELHGLPHAIGRLTNLEVLNLGSNFSDLTELPETMGDLIKLRELDLSNNQIRALPDAFFRLENLTKLNLDQNPLVIPPVEIVNKGLEAVEEFMKKRWLDIVAKEQQKSLLEANKQQQGGWLAWGTSLLTNVVSGVSQSVGGYAGGGKSSTDSYLDQQL
ncbi:hypothetical protein JRO89_XS05G0091500 [Xanthoceras sorbifolium]|uniref:Plant intracellular Ras-group-related LRR protein 3 n=1 Tax=Xanthoceras sorbifolium TaxID=99658 RepID=A0ABQ8I139_9ROSI|nr:hypothetical protein JRO89_XS05G0091500 [Xanthoceras sorbifolium]